MKEEPISRLEQETDILPFNYDTQEQWGTFSYHFYFCIFQRDFWQWQAGYEAKIIYIDFIKGHMIEYDYSGENIIKETYFSLSCQEKA